MFEKVLLITKRFLSATMPKNDFFNGEQFLRTPVTILPQNIDGSAMVIPVPILSLALLDDPLDDPALNAFHRFHAHGFHAFANEPLEFCSERDARMLLFKQ
jgi:hypothetical protein